MLRTTWTWIGVYLFLGCYALTTFCTFSPFSESEVNFSERLTIRGQVQLDDGATPDGVYIWLEGLNVSAWTDATGSFELQLPSPQEQSGGGVSGEYILYFYVGNYRLESVVTVLRDGYFVFGERGIDTDGDVAENIVLQKLADISTVVDPEIVSRYDSQTLIQIRVTVQTHTNPLKASLLLADNTYILGYFFREENTPIEDAIYPTVTSEPVEITLSSNTSLERGFSLPYYGVESKVAAYEVYPYVRIVQDDLPEGLVESIAENATEYHHDFLNIPCKQDPGYFQVVEFVGKY